MSELILCISNWIWNLKITGFDTIFSLNKAEILTIFSLLFWSKLWHQKDIFSKINWPLEVFKSFDQNSNQKTEFLPIGKVENFQWRRCLQNSSKNHKFRWLFFKNFDQNSGWKCSCSWLWNSYGILQEFWLEYWWENLGANTSDDFGIL